MLAHESTEGVSALDRVHDCVFSWGRSDCAALYLSVVTQAVGPLPEVLGRLSPLPLPSNLIATTRAKMGHSRKSRKASRKKKERSGEAKKSHHAAARAMKLAQALSAAGAARAAGNAAFRAGDFRAALKQYKLASDELAKGGGGAFKWREEKVWSEKNLKIPKCACQAVKTSIRL